ncbi:MAG TPA: hypothetical protein EYN62_01965 [Gammaproteobacteria bacterium]|nr:hypothetical protein [Gammaproteobacteria bacterium]
MASSFAICNIASNNNSCCWLSSFVARKIFHAAAGGVGLIACQWARSEGLELIGTAGSDESALKIEG